MTRRIVGRGGIVVALVAGSLTLAAPPAAAEWRGTLARADSDPSSGALVLKLTAKAPTYDLHFGLYRAGYSVSNVSADQPGPGGGNPACTSTNRSDLTTNNAGVDCTFMNAVQAVTVTFTTSPRYPDGGGGNAYDGNDSTISAVAGPGSGASPPPLPIILPPGNFIKDAARSSAMLTYSDAEDACYATNSTENLPSLGIFKGILTNILEDRQECLDRAQTIYDEALAHLDPPDQNFLAVAVPTISSSGGLGPARCPRSAAKPAAKLCAALRPGVLRRDGLSARTVAIWSATVTTLNRLSTAAAASNGNGIAIQGAALRALEAEVLVASKAEDNANAALAAVLRKWHVSVRISRKSFAAGETALHAGKLPSWALKALARRGISKASFRSTLGTLAPPKPRATTLTKLLGQRTISGSAASGLAADAAKGSAQDLANLATGLENAGVINQALHDTVTSDASAIAEAGSPSARASAVAKFIADAAHAPGEAARLLTAAAQTFTG